MEEFFSGAFLLVLFMLLLLHLLSLPANWMILLLVGGWRGVMPESFIEGMDVQFFAILFSLAVAGEILEFVLQFFGSKRYGASGKGMWGAFFGGLMGALFGVPFFLGFGAFLGALGGAFVGCCLVERISGKSWEEAGHAAQGALVGRFLGIIIKGALGLVMVVMTAQAIWPEVA